MKILETTTSILNYIEGKEIVNASKSGYILANVIPEGQKMAFNTYTSDGNIEAKETANAGDVIATRSNDDGIPVIDDFGHMNQWVMSQETLGKKYVKVEGYLYKPAGGTQKFVKVDEDVRIFVPWGEGGALVPLDIKKGGYLNVTNRNDIYGIAEAEFNETYQIEI